MIHLSFTSRLCLFEEADMRSSICCCLLLAYEGMRTR